MSELVSLDRLSVTRGRALVLDDFSLVLGEGETVALLGEEGSGSDAVLRAVAGVPDRHERILGSLSWRGTKPRGRMRIAWLPSPSSGALSPARSIGSQLARIIARKFSVPRSTAGEDLKSALAKLEGAPSPDILEKKPDQADPAAVAWALLAHCFAQTPELILADDPVRGLSPAVARAFTATLVEHRRRLDAALLYNARALDPAIWASDRVVVIRQGRIVEEGPVDRLQSNRTHAYTRLLFKALPLQTVPRPRKKIARGEVLVRVRNLVIQKGPEAQLRSINKISFELGRGASLALVGEDGSGRRAVVRTVLGIDRIRSGRVMVDAVDLGALSRAMKARMRRRIAYVAGSDSALDPRMTINDTIDEPLRAHLKLPREIVSAHREAALTRVGLASHDRARRVESLSHFDNRRLQIARAMVSAPMLTIVDEPLKGLDAYAQTIVRDLLMDLREQDGLSFLVVTSDLALAVALSEEALVFNEGTVVSRGSPAELSAQTAKLPGTPVPASGSRLADEEPPPPAVSSLPPAPDDGLAVATQEADPSLDSSVLSASEVSVPVEAGGAATGSDAAAIGAAP